MNDHYNNSMNGVILFIIFGLILFFISFLFAKNPIIWFYFSITAKLIAAIIAVVSLIKNPKNKIATGFLVGWVVLYIIPMLFIIVKLLMSAELM